MCVPKSIAANFLNFSSARCPPKRMNGRCRLSFFFFCYFHLSSSSTMEMIRIIFKNKRRWKKKIDGSALYGRRTFIFHHVINFRLFLFFRTRYGYYDDDAAEKLWLLVGVAAALDYSLLCVQYIADPMSIHLILK